MFVVGFGACMHVVSKKYRNSAELDGDHEDIEESNDGDDGQRRGANQRRSDGICQRIALMVMLHEETPAVLSLWKLCEDHGYTSTGPAVKNCISPKMGNPMHKPTETANTNKNEGREEVRSDLLHDLLDWLQEFRENLVDESRPLEPRRNPAP